MDSRVALLRGDITKLEVDIVVNAANVSLMPGGGVDGAIRRAAGEGLNDACRKIGGCPTGSARITDGYGLSAKWVIHTVGPIWQGGCSGEPDLLAGCYRTSLTLASSAGAASIAFPAISTGIYGFPRDRAASIAIRACDQFLAGDELLEQVILVSFTDNDQQFLTRAMTIYDTAE